MVWKVSCWRFLTGRWSMVGWTSQRWYDQIETLIENNQCYTYHVGDSQHTHNIQINKAIGENEKYVFYFIEKNMWTFWPIQYLCSFCFFFCFFLAQDRGQKGLGEFYNFRIIKRVSKFYSAWNLALWVNFFSCQKYVSNYIFVEIC